MEGDRTLQQRCRAPCDFYPRPPGGGRHQRHYSRSLHRQISIHALRVEGDQCHEHIKCVIFISIHALRVEGDCFRVCRAFVCVQFLSTPSGWRATAAEIVNLSAALISIHALRVEGDLQFSYANGKVIEFLSTPSGWRATKAHGCRIAQSIFLSTPSGWRATVVNAVFIHGIGDFYPRPPGGGRQAGQQQSVSGVSISIHALRVEGDDGNPNH